MTGLIVPWNAIWIAMMAAVLALGACSEPLTAARYATANGALAATAQMDQYRRDAAATGTARAIQFQADVIHVQSTAQAATATAGALAAAETAQASVNATATARVEAAMTQTAAALANSTAQAAQAAATNTAIAEAQLTQIAHARATATKEAEQHATATAAVVETQTTILLESQAAEAQRRRIENTALTILLVIGSGVSIYLIFSIVRTLNRNADRAGMVQTYGLHKNPLLVTQNGRGVTIINPLTNTAAITTLDGQGQIISNELPELMRQSAILGALAVLHQQAQHMPFPPASGQPEKSARWKLAGLEHEVRTGVLTTPDHSRLAPGPELPSLGTPTLGNDDDIVEGEYRVVEPGHPEIRDWLTEVKQKLLQSPEA